MLDSEKIHRVDSLICLDCIISKESGCSEDANVECMGHRCVFVAVEKIWKNSKIGLKDKMRIVKAVIMTDVKNSSEKLLPQFFFLKI